MQFGIFGIPEEVRKTLRTSDTFVVYADGSSLGNPGMGASGFILMQEGKAEVRLAVTEADVTNNQMELKAGIRAMIFLEGQGEGPIRCDSEYVVKGVNEWRKGWETRGWKTAAGKPVANSDLWKWLFNLVDRHPGARFEWVKGHANDVMNNLVDELVRGAAMAERKNAQDGYVFREIMRLEDRIAKLRTTYGLEVVSVIEKAVETLGSEQNAWDWMFQYHAAVGRPPIELILEDRSADVVELLEMLKHGVYA